MAASFASSGVAAMRQGETAIRQSAKLAAQRDSQLAGLNGSPAQDASAKYAANRQVIAFQAANAAWARQGGVLVTRSAPAAVPVAAIHSAVQSAVKDLTMNATFISQLDGREVSRTVTEHQFIQASYGSTAPGLR